MSDDSHAALVGGQFGAQADAYVASAVHAGGADLAALIDLVADLPAARVLDLGCGGGHVTYQAAARVGEVVAYDLSPEMLEAVARTAAARGLANVTTEQGLAERLPFADASFDAVLCRYSAHHWGDFQAGLKEARRVLKPGGVAGFVDSVSPGPALLDTFLQTLEMLRDCSHVRSRSRAEWEVALAEAGLAVEATRTFRVRLDFASWIARIGTPKVQADAIRALQTSVSETVRRHFAVEADGTFLLDVALFAARRPSA